MRLRRRTARLALATAGIFVGALASAAPGMAAAPETVYGLTVNDQLTVFSSDKPGAPTVIPIDGLNGADNLVGIDFRPATGQLFAIGRDGGGNGRLYRIDTVSGDATEVGGQLGGVLSGTQHGFDFNPVPDRIRVVNNEPDDNFRVNPNNGTVAATDTNLTYDAADANAAADPNVEAVAYTNSIGGSTSTRLFGIDTSLNTLTQFGPGNADPNNGVMTTRGPLGLDVDEVAGFDIAPGGGQALAALRPAGGARPKLYSIDTAGPTAGAARDLGTIGSANPMTPGPVIEDIAIAPSVREFAALTNGPNQQLFTFFSDAPEDTSDPVNVTGLPAGVQLVGIDTRPANGQLVGVGDNERLYTINPDTGAASVVGTGPFSPSLAGTGFGVDFNPVPDRLRVTSTTEQNLRINPATGVGSGATPPSAADTPLINPGDPDPDIVGSAYTNSEPGASNTTLYGIDADNALVRQGDVDGSPSSPNAGVLTTIGALGIDAQNDLGYDIVPEDDQGFVATDGDGDVVPNEPALYSVNPGGAAVPRAPLVGAIGAPAGKTVVGLAFLDDTVVSLASANQTVGEDDGTATITLTRDGDLDRTATATVRTVNGSATAPQDFGALTNTTVTFAPGETVKTVSVPINNDTADEPNETFGVVLSPVTGRAGNHVTLVKIADNDNPPASGGGNGGTNVINGTSGNDTINGTSGNDVINCGSGNDVVNGGGGDDVINCGAGNDRIRGGSGDDRINGESGNDRIDGNSGNDRIRGGSGNDRLSGSSGDDRIFGDSGNDRISGGTGDDRISGGSGNDRISGGNGRDRLSGDSGRDRISGNDGRDRLSGGSGNDRLSGGDGRDRLNGGPGRDRSRQ